MGLLYSRRILRSEMPDTSHDIEIRSYADSDLTACRSLWVELTLQHRVIYDHPGIGGDDPGLQFDEHLETVGGSNLWVAVADGEVIGLTGIQEGDHLTEIEPLVVTASMRGGGVGRLLVDHVVAEARRRGVTLLSVRPVARNADAIRFYRDAGFDVLGFIEMFTDLTGKREWIDGERIADRDFKV